MSSPASPFRSFVLAFRVCVAVQLVLAVRVAAQTLGDSATVRDSAARDSAAHRIPPVHRTAWKPALVLTAATAALIPLDKPIMRELRRPAHVRSEAWIHGAQLFEQLGASGGVQIIGPALWGIGIVTRTRGPADIGLHLSETFVAATAVHYVTRAFIGRPRPTNFESVSTSEFHLRFDWKRNKDGQYKAEEGSFPSGHSLTTFAAATAMHYEIGAWAPKIATPVRIASWTIAVGDGLARAYRDNHWASDIMGAAAIGVFVGRTMIGVQHTHPNNVVDRVLRTITFTPAPNGSANLGMAILW